MITIPSILNYKNVVVFPDDEDCNLFYTIKTTPEITMVDGQPVFSGLFWTDRADGSGGSVAGLAGGWINFDSFLGVSEDVLEEIKGKIKAAQIQETRRNILLKKERERLGLIAKARGSSSVPDPEVAPIRDIHFGAINFTEGTVTLLEESGGDIVAWSSAGGPASLIGDNNAAFALRLSPTGAAIWYKSLKDGAKAISIRYDLKFQLRLPSLEIRAWAGSSQKKDITREVTRVWKNQDQGCSDADVERIDVKSVTENLLELGLMNIEIKKGSTEISDEHVSQLRNMAMKLIEDKVKEILKSRVRGMSEEERKTSMIALISEEVNSFVELRFTQEDVVEWQIAPQGTIMNFLEKVPQERRNQVTKLVDLSEHEVETISMDINVNAPWDETPFVNAVKVDLDYPTANQQHSKIFNKSLLSDTWNFRRPKNDDGKVNYDVEVFFKGISKPLKLKTESTNGQVNVNIGKVGLVDIQFKPHPNLLSLAGNNKINAIQVDLKYKKEGDLDHFSDALVFTPEEVEGKNFSRITGSILDAPLEIEVKYFAKNGKTIVMPGQKYYMTENNTVTILSPNPFEDTLDLAVELPFIPDESVKKIIVEFKYEDANNQFESSERVILSAEDNWESVMAKIVLLDKSISKFKYKYNIITVDDIAKSAWIVGDGDAEIIILPLARVMITTSALGIGGAFTSGLLTLIYKDGDVTETKEIFLTPENTATAHSWYLPQSSNGNLGYTYQLSLMKSDGTSKELSGSGQGKILQLQTTL